MRGDIPPVALKLLTSLPVRTHCAQFGAERMDRTEYMRLYMKARRGGRSEYMKQWRQRKRERA